MFIWIIVLNPIILLGQNLVFNPSFELNDTCPSAVSQINRATGWSSFRESPDYFNNCSTDTMVSVPQNIVGFQIPHTGSAYSGEYFHVYTDIREYFGSQLISPLIPGTKYYVSYFVTLGAIDPAWGMTCATNNHGALFTMNQYSVSNPLAISNYCHVNSTTVLTDTSNWFKVTGSFVADSAYQYIALGNFYNDSNTTIVSTYPDTVYMAAYYFFDDICVSTDSSYTANWTGIMSETSTIDISVYPNPTYTNAIVKLGDPKDGILNIKMFNIHGNLVRSMAGITSDEIEIVRNQLPAGLYIIQLYRDKQLIGSGRLIFQ